MIEYRIVADLMEKHYEKKCLNDFIDNIPSDVFESALSHAERQNKGFFLNVMRKDREKLNSKYDLYFGRTRYPYVLETGKNLTLVELAILCSKCDIDENLFISLIRDSLKTRPNIDIDAVVQSFLEAVQSFKTPNTAEIDSTPICYVCGKPLDNDASSEHVILDSLGGLLKAPLLHAKCNASFGSNLDSDFCNQMQILAKMIGIQSKKSIKKRKKYNGLEYPSIDVMNDKKEVTKIGIGLKQPILVYTAYKSGKTSINAFETEDNLRAFLRKRYRVLVKQGKNPTWNPDELPIQTGESNQVKYFYNFVGENKPGFRFGGHAFYKSFLKMSINYYLFNNRPISLIQDAIQYLVHNDGNYKKYGALYYTNEIAMLENICGISSKIYHLMYLKGDPENKSIYCYIDLFGSHKVISILSNNYFGDSFEYKWCYDLMAKTELDITNFVLQVSESYLSSVPFVTTNLSEQAIASFKKFFLKVPEFIPGITAIINDNENQ